MNTDKGGHTYSNSLTNCVNNIQAGQYSVVLLVSKMRSVIATVGTWPTCFFASTWDLLLYQKLQVWVTHHIKSSVSLQPQSSTPIFTQQLDLILSQGSPTEVNVALNWCFCWIHIYHQYAYKEINFMSDTILKHCHQLKTPLLLYPLHLNPCTTQHHTSPLTACWSPIAPRTGAQMQISISALASQMTSSVSWFIQHVRVMQAL